MTKETYDNYNHIIGTVAQLVLSRTGGKITEVTRAPGYDYYRGLCDALRILDVPTVAAPTTGIVQIDPKAVTGEE